MIETKRQNQAHNTKLHRRSLVDLNNPICNSRPTIYVRHFAKNNEEVTCGNCRRVIRELELLETSILGPQRGMA